MRQGAGTVPPTAGLPLRVSDLWGRDSDLEGALSRQLGLPPVQLECSGTASLVVALETLRRLAPERREVIVPAYTCPLVALAVAHCGLELRLCDLARDTLDLDAAMLERLAGPRTLAIVPTHLAGRVVDVRPALACARRVGAWVIEDAAQAMGARVEGEAVGLQGDIGFYSLAVGKGLTLFEGGVLLARDAALRGALRETSRAIVPANWAMEWRRSMELLGYAAFYRPRALTWAYGEPLQRALAEDDWVVAAGDDFPRDIPMHRPGAWRRSVGVRALPRLAGFLAEGKRRAAARMQRLARIPGLELVQDTRAAESARGVWPVVLVRLATHAARDALLRRHWASGWGLGLPFVHALPDYARYAGVVPAVRPNELPAARDWAARLLTISNSPWLDDARFDAVCEAIASA